MSIYKAIRGTADELRSYLESASFHDKSNALSEILHDPSPDPEKVEIGYSVINKMGVGAAVRSAARYGHTDDVKRLLEMPHRARRLKDAIEEAAAGGHVEIVRMLLESEAPVRDDIKDVFPKKDNCEDGDHAVLNAIRGGHGEVVRALVEGGVSVNFMTRANRTPLEMAQTIQPELVPLLKELGAKAAGPETMNLYQLAEHGHLDHVPARIPAETPEKRHQACLKAIEMGHKEIAALILDSEVLDETPANAMTAAAGAGQLELMQWLKKEYGVKYGSKATFKSWNASHAASYSDRVEVLEFLISKKIPMDVGDKDDKLPLHWAALGKSAKCAKLLLDHGANPNAKDDEGKKPLFYVSYYTASTPESKANQAEVTRLLKGKGAKTKSAASWKRGLKKKLKPHARTFHKLRTRQGAGDPRASRFGGMPFLAEGESWPLCATGGPMLFVLQLDLSTLPFDAGTGLVRVFIDPDTAYKEDGTRILVTESVEGRMSAAPAGGRILMPREISGTYKGKPDLPGADAHELVELDPNEAELLGEICASGDKMGGWPHWIQDPEWRGTDRLLLQADTGGSLAFSYGDSGIGFLLQSSSKPTTLKMVWQTL